MPMEVWPAETGDITVPIGTIVPEQKYGILEDDLLLVFDTQVLVYLSEVVILERFVAFRRVVGEYDIICFRLERMSA